MRHAAFAIVVLAWMPANGSYWEKAALPTGRPALSARFTKMLLEKPIPLQVEKVTISPIPASNGALVTQLSTIEFKGGTNVGVFLGMTSEYEAEFGAWLGEMTVTCVDADSCTATIKRCVKPDKNARLPAPGETWLAGNGNFKIMQPDKKTGGKE